MEHTPAIAPRTVPLWGWLVAALALALIYLLAADNGLVLGRSAGVVHELFHDARHFAGVPCH
ncbi:MAG: CbtB-domain containing protein [Actinobacteria bacterium]|nr:CbtB-domain containing protein [Actinomycetota bacterium]